MTNALPKRRGRLPRETEVGRASLPEKKALSRVERRSAKSVSKQSIRWESGLRGAGRCPRGHATSLRS